MAKKKYICAGCNKCTEPCTVELSGDADMTKDPAKMLHCGTWVEVPVEENTNKEQLPKLTTEVFSMEECPDWAQYAAVDPDGEAYWYDEKPELLLDGWVSTGTHFARRVTQNNTMTRLRYDSSDWMHSCIERLEERLPKLTTEVFATNECPEWAQYAAVDSDGVAYWYADKPELNHSLRGWSNTGEHNVQRLTLCYDSTDWKNSLIEHPDMHRPELTQAVFKLSDTPVWAQYAAVDADGAAHWFSKEPVKPAASDRMWRTHGCSCRVCVPGTFVARSWRDSCIRRSLADAKLTEKIFDHPECPADAVVAVVNADGTATWGTCADIEPYGGGFRTKEPTLGCWTRIPGGACFDASDWKNSAVYRAGVQPKNTEALPKLTHDVFSNSTHLAWKYVVRSGKDYGMTYTDCPYWARYAAIAETGTMYVYENKPMFNSATWSANGGRYAVVCDAGGKIRKFDAADCEYSLSARPKSEQLPRLTVKVFSLPQCPEWAKYVAVDEDGIVCYYKHKPYTNCSRWDTAACSDMQVLYDEHNQYIRYDATDWEHSLIERPAVVPDWFKPGVLAYNNDTHSFFHVTDSTEYCENYLEAKVRPFNAVELERKLGQSVLGIFNSRLLVTGFRPKGIASDLPEICVLGTKWITAEELLTFGRRPQGIKQYRSTEGTWIDCGLSN